MKAEAEKFIGFIHPDQRRPSEWVGILTWRLGFRGPFLVRGITESDVREKLRKLDPTVRFHEHFAARNRGGSE